MTYWSGIMDSSKLIDWLICYWLWKKTLTYSVSVFDIYVLFYAAKYILSILF